MISSNLKIAFRALRKNRLFTFLNFIGLSTGLAAALLMGLWVRDELSFDRHHERAERIFRIHNDLSYGGQASQLAVAPAPMAEALVADYPMVEAACRFRQTGFITGKKGNEIIEEGLSNSYVDASFFDIFSVKMLEGDPKTALREPRTMVISEKIARKYFGTATGVVGKTIRINDVRDERITGVMADWPAQSHFHYDFLFSMASLEEARTSRWLSNNFQTYVLLREGVKKADLEAKLPEVAKKYINPELLSMLGTSLEEGEKNGDYLRYSLQNVRDIHLRSDRIAEHEANSDIQFVWIFGIVAAVILGLACINFMNLSTARSAHRAREVGVRKALGSARGPLVWQFFSESFVLTFFSFASALVLAKMALPAFNHFAAKSIEMSFFDWKMMASVAVLMLVTAVLAGLWPAFFLSNFRPVEAFRSQFSQPKTGAARLRSGLVVVQFCASIALIVSVLTVKKQLEFIQNKRLGYDKEQLVQLRNTWYLRQKTTAFKADLLKIAGIEAASGSSFLPTPSSRNELGFLEKGGDPSRDMRPAQFWEVDFDYQKTMGLEMASGRWLDERLASDSAKCVVNESAVRAFGWADPLGKKLVTFTDPTMQNQIEIEVVGVVKNFHFESLRENVAPQIFGIADESGSMLLRLEKSADAEKTMASVGELFKKYLPAQPFAFRFIDQEFDRQYRAEQRISGLLSAFAAFAIFIACLGLFGLAAFMAERRVKEIGIRKTLGASVSSLHFLLAKDFLRSVVVALLIASPVAFWAMEKWLAGFAFRIKMGWEIFVFAGLAALGVAFLTVSFQAIKAALADPVKSLRSE